MRKLLHIIATPRGSDSRTLKVSGAFLDAFSAKNLACVIEEIDLYKEELPSLVQKMVEGKYILLGGGELPENVRGAWRGIESQINRFLSVDLYLLSTPMWNFGVPFVLKHYIDIIVQPRYLFRYTSSGVEGLAKNKKMAVVTSRGGDYGPASPFRGYDFLEPYLRGIFGFVGITDMQFVNAQPMDALGPEVRDAKIKEAIESAKKIAEAF